jgi:uncharacterized membrane protein YhaH (DUF805 family)
MKFGFIWFFLSFKGRIARQEFWLGFVALILIFILARRPLEELGLSYFRPKSGRWPSDRDIDVALKFPRAIFGIVLLWPLAAIYVKRLHDLNFSAWWLLALPIAGIAARTMNFNGTYTSLLVSLIILGLLPGSHGTNRFDAQPMART